MKVNVRLKFGSKKLIQKYCDSQGIPVANCIVLDIIRDELSSWLNQINVEVDAVEVAED